MNNFTFCRKQNKQLMKAFITVLTFVFFLCSCLQKQLESDKEATIICQRLSEIVNNKKNDVLVMKQALDNAFVVTKKVSSRPLDSLFAAVSRLYGNELFSDKPEEARDCYLRGIEIGMKSLALNDEIIIRLYRGIALTYYNADDFKTALTYFDYIKITTSDSSAYVLKIQNMMNVAECYKKLNDKKGAERIFKEAEPLAIQYYDRSKLASFYKLYSSCLRTMKKYHEAIDKAQIGLSIIEKSTKNNTLSTSDSNTLADCHAFLAYALQDSGVYKLAEQHYVLAISIYKKTANLNNYKRCLSNMGIMYRFDKQFDKAEKTLTSGIALFNQDTLDDYSTRLKASFYVNRSEVYLETKQYPKAIADQDSAIYFFRQYDKNPTLTAVMLQARPVLLSVLTDKAKALAVLAEKGIDTEGYQKALKLTDTIVALADDIRADYFSDDAKLTLANDIKPALEKAITLCQNLYKQTNNAQYLEKAFGFVEYSRSMVLYENARLANQLPADLKTENAQLKAQEAALMSKNNVEELQKYLQHKRQFREKIKALNKNKLASVTNLQSNLLTNDQTAFIEYFVGDSSIFTFMLSKNDIKAFEIKKPQGFEASIGTFRQEFTQRKTVSDASSFSRQATALYAVLLRGPLSQLPTTVSKLVIAPDGVLAYLPFEVLTAPQPPKGEQAANSPVSMWLYNKKQNSPKGEQAANSPAGGRGADFRQNDFLLKHFTVSYAYSANLLLLQKQAKQRETKHLFASFIAKYEEEKIPLIADNSTSKGQYHATALRSALSRDGLMDLQGAKDEVSAIKKVIGNKAFGDSLATEGSFKREAAQYRILHLAMHAYADDQDPMLSHLLFTLDPKNTTEDGDLTVAELYTMNLNADLAVLSACNTGFGTLSKGEGVMSLARAFTYAGVPATVTSLWEAPDATTPEIMESFYKNLKLGMLKDEALRQAKLTYLKNTHESLAANPFLWASFVPMGNMDAINLEEKGPLSNWMSNVGFWISGGLGMLTLFWGGFIWKIKKSVID